MQHYIGVGFPFFYVVYEMNILLMTYDNQPTISEVKSKLVENGKFYPNYYKLYQLALTIPTGSVKCERSISVLRRINNYARCSMAVASPGGNGGTSPPQTPENFQRIENSSRLSQQ